MDVNDAKNKLQAIIAQAKLRREAEEAAPLVAAAPSEPEPPPSVSEPEPTPQSHPHLFIEVHTAELVELVEHRGTENETRWEVLSGRTLVTFRKRTVEDGDATVVVEQPKAKQRPTGEKVEWPTWSQSGRVDPRVAARYPGNPDPRSFGGTGARNVGVMRSDGSIIGQ